jgi:hypothetical protein
LSYDRGGKRAAQLKAVRPPESKEYHMIRLISALPSDIVPTRPSLEERLYANPGGQLTAVFREPWEIRMGTYAWQFDLQSQGASILSDHPYLASSPVINLVRCPIDLAPWSPVESILGLLTWEKFGAILYSVPEKRVRELTVSSPPSVSLKWSNRFPFLSVVYRDHCTVFDSKGSEICIATWPSNALSNPFVFWWPDSLILLALVNPPDERPPHLLVFSAETGAIENEIIIDPGEIFPYHKGEFAELPRDGYALQVAPGTLAVARLLDTWHNPVFDPVNLSLTLAVYRPRQENSMEGHGSAHQVEEVWATFKLAA